MQPPTKYHDVVVVRRSKYGSAKVVPVPPEEFGITRRARRIRDADYSFHEVIKTESDLIAQGYDRDQVKAIPTYVKYDESGIEQRSRDTVEETQGAATESLNRAIRQIKVTEHYMRMDYEGDGKARLYRVTTGGDQGEILRKEGALDIEQMDVVPFAAITPYIVTHRFYGRSLADLVMDIQKIKTALVRGVQDNVYLANNPRPEIAESAAGEDTLDDLLVWRPGAPIRTKVPGGLMWQQIPPIAQYVFPVVQYWDQVREWRTGVTSQGQGIDANALQNQSATAVNQVYSAAQAKMKLIARIFAETGIRDLFLLLHHAIRSHGSKARTVRLRNQWVSVDPRQWKTRSDLVVHVGLGTGDKSQQLAHHQMVINAQITAAKNPEYGLTTPENLYNSAKKLVKLTGEKNPDQFFTDPRKNPATGQKQPDPKIELETQKLQMQIQAEQIKAQNELQVSQIKAQNEFQLRQVELAQQLQLERERIQAEIQLKREQMGAEMALKQRQMEIEAQLKAQTLAMGVQAGGSSGIEPVHMGGEVG